MPVRAEAQDGVDLTMLILLPQMEVHLECRCFLGRLSFWRFLDVIEPSNPELVGSYYSHEIPFSYS
jgi:hypothetical protein